jgi:NAD+ synthase
MSDRLRIALAPLDPLEEDVARNAARIRAARAEAADLGADLLVTPAASLAADAECFARPGFLAISEAALAALAAGTADGGPGLVVGGPWMEGGRLHEAVFLLDAGRILARRARHVVPPGGMFDPGPVPGPVVFRGVRLGLMAGADWRSPSVPETLAETGAEILLAVDASSFAAGEPERRVDEGVARVVETGLPLLFVSRLGGGEGPVFDGGGFALNADRVLAFRQPAFAAALSVTEWLRGEDGWACAPQPLPPPMPAPEQLWRALTSGLAGHVARHGYAEVLLDRGGEHAALAAALATEAVGAARVRGVLLPAQAVAEPGLNLPGARRDIVSIAPALDAFRRMLGTAPEAPIRAAALAALAAEAGALLLDLRDRTDLALGHAAPPGFALLRDLWKGEAGELARWRGLPAPAPGVPDAIPRALLEEGQDPAALAARGFDPVTIDRVWRSLDWRGYKRRQAPPGVTLGRHAHQHRSV